MYVPKLQPISNESILIARKTKKKTRTKKKSPDPTQAQLNVSYPWNATLSYFSPVPFSSVQLHLRSTSLDHQETSRCLHTARMIHMATQLVKHHENWPSLQVLVGKSTRKQCWIQCTRSTSLHHSRSLGICLFWSDMCLRNRESRRPSRLL